MKDQANYTLSTGIEIFKNNIRQNLTSLVTLSTLIFLYLAVFTVNYSATKAVDNLTDIKTIRVFIVEGANKEHVEKELFALQIPADIEFFSKKKSKKRVLDTVPDSKNISKLPAELFPEFFEIRVADYAAVEGLLMENVKKIDNIGGVKSVEYGKRVSERMKKVKHTAYIFVILLTAVTGLSTAFVIYNTIRLSMFKSRKKMMIYNLVGATRSFIKGPYMIASFVEISIAYSMAILLNIIFVKSVTAYLLQGSYFALFTPNIIIYLFFYSSLLTIALLSASFCVGSFLSGLESINES